MHPDDHDKHREAEDELHELMGGVWNYAGRDAEGADVYVRIDPQLLPLAPAEPGAPVPYDPRDVPCGHCRAAAGSPCKRPSGHTVWGGASHSVRHTVAIAAVIAADSVRVAGKDARAGVQPTAAPPAQTAKPRPTAAPTAPRPPSSPVKAASSGRAPEAEGGKGGPKSPSEPAPVKPAREQRRGESPPSPSPADPKDNPPSEGGA